MSVEINVCQIVAAAFHFAYEVALLSLRSPTEGKVQEYSIVYHALTFAPFLFLPPPVKSPPRFLLQSHTDFHSSGFILL